MSSERKMDDKADLETLLQGYKHRVVDAMRADEIGETPAIPPVCVDLEVRYYKRIGIGIRTLT
jgi:hypothetical protein